ncbi:hypothetical protein NKJ40_17320 [Mesorhizobium sp. M0119]|uniref:hypothetical protein n=1 Tax=unclassified Mesorhizobium TaxID=325217 RepID=UPI00333DE5DE
MSDEPITVLMVNEYPDYIDAQVWAAELKSRVPQLEFRLWPDAGDKSDIDVVLIDMTSPGRPPAAVMTKSRSPAREFTTVIIWA